MSKRNYSVDYSIYTFKPEDDWGCYKNGEVCKPNFDKLGYAYKGYKCNDGKFHNMNEHTAKWEYFNGRIPEGLVIDHVIPIGNGGTNKLSNLRCVTQKENCNNKHSIKNYKKGNSGKNQGRIPTEEARKKMSIARKGTKASVETVKKLQIIRGKKLVQINPQNNTKTEWISCSEVRRVLGYNAGAVSDACRGEYSHNKGHEYKGSFWYYK